MLLNECAWGQFPSTGQGRESTESAIRSSQCKRPQGPVSLGPLTDKQSDLLSGARLVTQTFSFCIRLDTFGSKQQKHLTESSFNKKKNGFSPLNRSRDVGRPRVVGSGTDHDIETQEMFHIGQLFQTASPSPWFHLTTHWPELGYMTMPNPIIGKRSGITMIVLGWSKRAGLENREETYAVVK